MISIEAAQALLDMYYNPPTPTHNLTIGRIIDTLGTGTVTVNGTVLAPDVPLAIEAGESVRIIATPSSGFRFVRWVVVSGGVFIPSATLVDRTFTMPDNDVELRAEFELIPPSYSITVSRSGTGNGTATASPTTAMAGTRVDILATANATSTFARWEVVSGNITIASPTNRSTNFIMPSTPVTVRAVFNHVPQQKGGTRVVDFAGTMSLTLPRGASGSSNTLTATVGNLPADARVTDISLSVNTASIVQVRPSYLYIGSSQKPNELESVWINLASNPVNNMPFFWNTQANATWSIRWAGTNVSSLPSSQTGTLSNARLTINYEYWE